MGWYPLRFEPIFRRYLWGGRRLATSLGKSIGSGNDYAESWEIVDHGEDQSVVRGGAFQGLTLHELLTGHGHQLLGDDYDRWSSQVRPGQLQDRFPLLFKFLDCHRPLSVQVHPNDEQGRGLEAPDLGKTEAWVVLESQPESRIYAGLRSGVNRSELAAAVASGTTEQVLHSFSPRPGDCVFIPAGTVHALGGGLVIAEIQQASDTTFRLFDWNRVDSSGRSRPLHLTESLAVTDFDAGPVDPVRPVSLSPGCEELVRCDKFVLRRRVVSEPGQLGGGNRCLIVAVIEGQVDLAGDPSGQSLVKGDTALLPACLGSVEFEPGSVGGTLLEISLS